MTRTLKALGLALFALFAMIAMAAQAASAANGKLTSTGPMTLTGTETGEKANRLTTFGAFVECPGSTYTGHRYTIGSETTVEEQETGVTKRFIPNGAETVTITPHYKQKNAANEPNCIGTLGTRATIDLNGCDYVIHLGETTGGVAGTYGVKFDIVCPTGKEITVTVWLSESAHTSEPNTPKCIKHIPPQNGLVGLHATDTGNGTFDLTGTVERITETQTRNSILCPAGTQEENAKMDFDLNIAGHGELGQPTGISLSHN